MELDPAQSPALVSAIRETRHFETRLNPDDDNTQEAKRIHEVLASLLGSLGTRIFEGLDVDERIEVPVLSPFRLEYQDQPAYLHPYAEVITRDYRVQGIYVQANHGLAVSSVEGLRDSGDFYRAKRLFETRRVTSPTREDRYSTSLSHIDGRWPLMLIIDMDETNHLLYGMQQELQAIKQPAPLK